MSKFYVGDRVRVTYPARSHHDEIGIVTGYYDGAVNPYVVTFHDGEWAFKEEENLRPADIAPQSDAVSHPAHYSQGMPEGVEVIDIVRAQKADYLHGNVIKYVLRWKFKNGVEDLKKAQQYLTWLIEQEEAKK